MHDEFVRDQFWAVVPNPNYWNGAPKLDRLINRYFEDETAATLALEAGEIQFTYVSGDVALRLAENDNYVIYQGPSGVTNYLIFNMREERFQDVRVRQAVLYAIDREAIAEIVLGGTATVVPCLAAYPAMWPEEYNDYAYNPDLARQLLEEAGWSQDEPIEIVPTTIASSTPTRWPRCSSSWRTWASRRFRAWTRKATTRTSTRRGLVDLYRGWPHGGQLPVPVL